MAVRLPPALLGAGDRPEILTLPHRVDVDIPAGAPQTNHSGANGCGWIHCVVPPLMLDESSLGKRKMLMPPAL